jgi:hypothetical protein
VRPLGRFLSLAVLALAGLAVPACQEGTPVAPTGTILHISAYPTRIGKTGSSTITIQAVRSNGNPVNPGTEIRLSSTIGSIEPVIYTDNDGVAHGTLRGTGRVGTATVSAYSGGVDAVTVDVSVGALATSISLQVNPTSLPEAGGNVDLIALVRDDQGQPLPDAEVNFLTEAGTLDSGGAFLTTDANGQVTDRLHVSAADTASQPDHIITVTAESGGSSGVISDTANISIQGPPVASFTFQISGNVVSFTDTSSGDPTHWAWDFGDNSPTSNEENPVHLYAASPGEQFIVHLTASNAFGSSTASALVQF